MAKMEMKSKIMVGVAAVVLAAFVAVIATPIVLLFRSQIYVENAQQMITSGLTLLGPIVAVLIGYYVSVFSARSSAASSEKVREIEAKVEKHPEQARFAWDLARAKLEAYFDRNLNHVNLIFWVSIAVMTVGFGLILSALFKSGQAPDTARISYITAAAGIITEFIGATFMFVYRSTIAQANSYMATLERINTVGMAVQLLETIPDDQSALKTATKAELVKLLLRNSSHADPPNRVTASSTR
jgi:hypothetical protein